jgi:hypothetical protein
MDPGSIIQCSTESPASWHTQEHRAPHSPYYRTHYLHFEMSGKPVPLKIKTCDLHWSTGNRRHKPAGLVPPEAEPLDCASWSLCGKSVPRTPTISRLGFCWASCNTTELYSLKPMQKIRLKNFHCLQAWFLLGWTLPFVLDTWYILSLLLSHCLTNKAEIF